MVNRDTAGAALRVGRCPAGRGIVCNVSTFSMPGWLPSATASTVEPLWPVPAVVITFGFRFSSSTLGWGSATTIWRRLQAHFFGLDADAVEIAAAADGDAT